ncbi:MAG: PIN domain-containing protein [Nitrospirae bacterium]|nr:PIN domain-containing protein [Nitrospirota bacterium]
MNDKILADTSVWVEFFRYETVAGNQLAALLSANSVCTCGIVLFELVQGVRSDKEKAVVLNSLSGLRYYEMNERLWQNSAALSAGLKKNGLTLPLSDIFIAAIAIEHDLSIFTIDRHFEQIPGARLWNP